MDPRSTSAADRAATWSRSPNARCSPSASTSPAPFLDVARTRGVNVLERSRLRTASPDHDRWRTALLFDGNIGIGGDPVALLSRVVELLRDDGRDHRGDRARRRRARDRRRPGRDSTPRWDPGSTGRLVDLQRLTADRERRRARGSSRRGTDDRRRFAVLAVGSMTATPGGFDSAAPCTTSAPPRGSASRSACRSRCASPPACGRTSSRTRPSWFDPIARPAGLYRFTQGLHVATGIASIPLLLAKLWVVYPKLFQRPVVRSAASVLEKVSIVPLVGGGIFMLFTGSRQHQPLVPVAVQLPHVALLGGVDHDRRARGAHRRQDHDHPSRAVADAPQPTVARRRPSRADDPGHRTGVRSSRWSRARPAR